MLTEISPGYRTKKRFLAEVLRVNNKGETGIRFVVLGKTFVYFLVSKDGSSNLEPVNARGATQETQFGLHMYRDGGDEVLLTHVFSGAQYKCVEQDNAHYNFPVPDYVTSTKSLRIMIDGIEEAA